MSESINNTDNAPRYKCTPYNANMWVCTEHGFLPIETCAICESIWGFEDDNQ